jgi:hypothetical protein
MQLAPAEPQILHRPIYQFGNFVIGLCRARLSWSVGNGRRLARVLTSRRIVGWRFHTLAGSAMR